MKSRSLLAGGFALALAVASVPAFQAVASTNENTPPGDCIPGAAAGECPGEGDGEGDNGGDENPLDDLLGNLSAGSSDLFKK